MVIRQPIVLDNSYQCDSCNKKFSRRSNAKRHIQVVHKGYAQAFNMSTGKNAVDLFQQAEKSRTGSLYPGTDTSNHKDLITDWEEELLNAILEKIRKPFEELESLVANLTEIPKAQYLSTQITSSFLSSDPVKVLQDSIDYISTYELKKRLIIYISKSNSVNPIIAESSLIETLRMGKYYRNRIKSRTKSV